MPSDLETCTSLRPDFAVLDDGDRIGATWTTDGEPRARYVVLPSNASSEERERQTGVLLDRCRRWIEAGDVAEPGPAEGNGL